MDLFSYNEPERENSGPAFTPLAERCRPLRLSEFVGHGEIVGAGTVLANEIARSRVKSMILWGPPGVG
ncbi:MAG: replication-associated recombination protein A, partial [Calditrichia bacterium]